MFTEDVLDSVSSITSRIFRLESGSTTTFWTDGLIADGACAPDTVMHLFTASEPAVPLASNDDCDLPGLPSGQNSCLSITPAQTLYVRLYVHAARDCAASSGMLHRLDSTGQASSGLHSFGGQLLSTAEHGFGWELVDTIELVDGRGDLPPTTSLAALVLTYDGACTDEEVSGLARSRPTPFGAELTPNYASWFFCRTALLVGALGTRTQGASARAYVNDRWAADADADGLGDLLEQELGTCDGVPGAACPWSVSPQDSDHDGLTDRAELIGIDGVYEDLPLARYGADPLHKDVFVEVDYLPSLAPLDLDEAQTVGALFALDPNGSANNPDGTPGLTVHFDSRYGATCESCGTLLGDWGGSGPTSWSFDISDDAAASLGPDRRGVFRWAILIDQLPGGTRGIASEWKLAAGRLGADFEAIFAHELGHTLGLGHGGADRINCKPNYRSLMNYVDAPTFSAGDGLQLDPWRLDETAGIGFESEALSWSTGVPPYNFNDHTSTTGAEVDWNRNGVIDDPNDPVSGEFVGTEGSPLLGLAAAVAECRGSVFSQYVPTKTTDQDAVGVAVSSGAVVVVKRNRFDVERLDTALFYSSLAPCIGESDAWCCDAEADGLSASCGHWVVDEGWLHVPGLQSGAALVQHPSSPDGELLLAYHRQTAAGSLFEVRRIHVDSAGTITADPAVPVPANMDPQLNDPTLVVDPAGQIYLYYLNTSEVVVRQQLDGALSAVGGPVGLEYAFQEGNPLYPVTSDELPAVTYLGSELHVVVRQASIVRALRATDEDGLKFVAEGPGPGSNQSSARGFVGPAHGALHLQAHDSRLYLWYPAGAGATRSPMRWQADAPAGSELPDFEYPSFDGTFIHDTNTVTRAGIKTAIYYWRPQTVWTSTDFGQLWHAPFGDGSFPYDLDDTDDIEVMGERGCCCLHAGLPSAATCVAATEACGACGGNGPCRFPDN